MLCCLKFILKVKFRRDLVVLLLSLLSTVGALDGSACVRGCRDIEGFDECSTGTFENL